MRTTRWGRAIGAVVGNLQPDPTSLPGIRRDPNVLLQFGDLETQVGIQEEPLAVFKRDKGHARVLATFTHEADAERYVLVLARPEIVSGPLHASFDCSTWPDSVEVDPLEQSVTWRAEDGIHRMTTESLLQRKHLRRVAWARNVTLEELLTRAARS